MKPEINPNELIILRMVYRECITVLGGGAGYVCTWVLLFGGEVRYPLIEIYTLGYFLALMIVLTWVFVKFRFHTDNWNATPPLEAWLLIAGLLTPGVALYGLAEWTIKRKKRIE